jgi:N,N'-diacetyllegionaminate synthase
LHAITSYPTHATDVNLRAMVAMSRHFPGVPVGYSDHTIGPLACLAAAALGATVVEKHFTWDRNAEGPDHMLSADPAEMTAIVRGVREIEVILGDGEKRPAAGEAKTRVNNRKSVVALRSLAAGQTLRGEDLAVKRPGTGIRPRYVDELVGRQLKCPVEADQVLTWDDIA